MTNAEPTQEPVLPDAHVPPYRHDRMIRSGRGSPACFPAPEAAIDTREAGPGSLIKAIGRHSQDGAKSAYKSISGRTFVPCVPFVRLRRPRSMDGTIAIVLITAIHRYAFRRAATN